MLELPVLSDEVDEARERLASALNTAALIRAARAVAALGERFWAESINLGQSTRVAHQGDAFQAQGVYVLILGQALRDGPEAPA